MRVDEVAAQTGGGSRRLYSYLSGSDNDEDDTAVPGRRGRHRPGDWRVPPNHGVDDDDDDDDGLSSPSWVRSGSGSESDAAINGDPGRTSDVVGRRVVDSAFGVYSRINDSGLTTKISSSSSSSSSMGDATVWAGWTMAHPKFRLGGPRCIWPHQ